MRVTTFKAIIAAALLSSTALPAHVLAQAAPSAPAVDQKAFDKQEAKDRKVVQKALRVASFAELETMVPDLRKVVANAPASWPMIDHQPGVTTIRVNDPSAALAAMLVVAASAEGKAGSGQGKAVAAFNTYGTAAFLLGTLAVERRQPEEALIWLDRGLAFQPDNLMLVTEKGSALILQHRFAEALAFYDAQPPIDLLAGMANPDGEARVQRSRGFCLTELNRLDEAEAAYLKSLELEPDHGGAKAELAYIRKLRAGGAKQGVDVYTGDKAKARQD
jgi:tetratricopeptide (TPR) repeat protein